MQLMAERTAASRFGSVSGPASGSASTSTSGTVLTSSSSPAIGITQKTPTATSPPIPFIPFPPVQAHVHEPAVPDGGVPEADILFPPSRFAQEFGHILQKWHWDISINESVKTKFNNRAKFRLGNTVSDYKENWRVNVDAAKPIFLSTVVWEV
ncbi:unnamed protein product [Cochlearia groenlandica]